MVQPTAYVDRKRDDERTLVVVFLRGGADGLNLVVPVEDDEYYRRRPTIGVGKRAAIGLDGLFGLHPALEPFIPAYRDGDLAIVHQAGSEDTTRSHFEAQDFMEHGGMVGGGWLGRYLQATIGADTSPLTAIAIGRTHPEVLRGAPGAVAFESFDAFSLGGNSSEFLDQLDRLYSDGADALLHAGRDTIGAVRRIETLRKTVHAPEGGALYGGDAFSNGLRQIAQLVKAKVGLRAATIDLGGWDTHFASDALMNPLITSLGTGLAAFRADLGAALDRVTVVVMTEFGRRVYENASFGTDHGRGSVMFLMGGGIAGGRVLHEWNGLQEEHLEGPGDVPVVHNYRDVLAPVLTGHGGVSDFSRVFPDYPLRPLPMYG